MPAFPFRNVLLLALSQAAMMTVVSLVLASSVLVGQQLGAPTLATLPLAAQYLATLLVLFPAARLMQGHGRRPVFVAAALLGAVGLLLAAWGIGQGSFALFVVAGLLIGVFSGIGQYFRFAAAEAVSPAQRSVAISLTLTGGVLAAVAGPALARASRELLATPFQASFLALALIALLAAALACGLRLPVRPAPLADPQPLPWRALLARPRLRLAIFVGTLGYALMGLLMTATPLAMQACGSFDFSHSSTVIQWHVVAMFAPSFITGSLIRRVGSLVVMGVGALLTLASIGVGVSGQLLPQFTVALVLLGVGWNFLYVGATALLTESCAAHEQARAQAANDTAVFLGMSVATLGAAPLVGLLGWQTLNLLAAAPVLLLMLVIVVHGRQARPALLSA